MTIKVASVWPVNANGEIVVQLGTGTGTITSYLPTDQIPTDSATNAVVLRYPDLDAVVLAEPLTGFVSGSGTVAATDTVLQAFNKLDGNDALKATSANAVLTGTTSTQAVVKNTRVVIAAGAVTMSATDNVIIVNKTSGAATVLNLVASPTTGREVIIKDGKGDALTNNITVTPAAGNIDGSATFVMNLNRQAVSLIYSGTEWVVV
jgi:hypothetical protein